MMIAAAIVGRVDFRRNIARTIPLWRRASLREPPQDGIIGANRKQTEPFHRLGLPNDPRKTRSDAASTPCPPCPGRRPLRRNSPRHHPQRCSANAARAPPCSCLARRWRQILRRRLGRSQLGDCRAQHGCQQGIRTFHGLLGKREAAALSTGWCDAGVQCNASAEGSHRNAGSHPGAHHPSAWVWTRATARLRDARGERGCMASARTQHRRSPSFALVQAVDRRRQRGINPDSYSPV